ncbi:MAG TPA: hypothetical protein PK530_22090, partial [Anaerolineales bacterium]|nr:hypothetical protein [Anaerolineales bacterium]
LANKINRIGIFLEIIGLLAVIPDFIGEGQINSINRVLNSFTLKLPHLHKQVDDFINAQGAFEIINTFFNISGLTGKITLFANFSISAILILNWIQEIYYPNAVRSLPNEAKLAAIQGILAFLWLDLVLIAEILNVLGKEPSKILLGLFVGSHTFISLYSMPIAGAAAYVVKYLIRSIERMAALPLRLTLTRVTLPLIFLGNLLQLVSTYL